MEYYSAIKRNQFESVVMRWRNLQPIVYSEVSQKEKNKYGILMHIYMGSRKMALMSLYLEQQWTCRHGEQTCGHGGRRRDKLKGWCWNTYITVCRIFSQWEFAVWFRDLNLGALCPSGWVGSGGRWERDSRGRECMHTYGQFMLMHGRNRHNTRKQLSSK